MTYRIETVFYAWKDAPTKVSQGSIVVGSVPEGFKESSADENIFFYCDTEDDWDLLLSDDNPEDFFIQGAL